VKAAPVYSDRRNPLVRLDLSYSQDSPLRRSAESDPCCCSMNAHSKNIHKFGATLLVMTAGDGAAQFRCLITDREMQGTLQS
jgi:hypothetical protein